MIFQSAIIDGYVMLRLPPDSARRVAAALHDHNRLKPVLAELARQAELNRSVQQPESGLRNTDGPLYLHRSLMPLASVDFRSPAERGQPDLFGNECEGVC